MTLQPVIGIECHVQLDTQSKLFCSCPVTEDNRSNQSICEVCTGQPGTLPSLNAKAVALGIRAGLALGAEVQKQSAFSRKNYFYPDLPKGYQITQHEHPLCLGGQVHALVEGEMRSFGLLRLHLEEDAGKLHHNQDSSQVDWNRAGRALVEIVSKPDLHSASEAAAYMRSLHRTLKEAEVCQGDLEKGQMRFDVNVSLHRPGTPLGPRVEIKNLNSFRFAQKAVQQEIQRQTRLLAEGKPIVSHTRGWSGGRCIPLRSKEQADDYRYFPEPDLGTLHLSREEIETQRQRLRACPLDRHLIEEDMKRVQVWLERYPIREAEVRQIQSDAQAAAFFESCVALGGSPKEMANWVQTELQRFLKAHAGDWALVALEPRHLVALQEHIDHGTLSYTAAKKVFETLAEQGGEVEARIESMGLWQLGDETALREIVLRVVADFPEECQKFREGQEKILGFLMGQLMRQTQGAADPRLLKRLLLDALMEHS